MYPNTNFARATVSVLTGALVALGSLGSAWSAAEFMPRPVAIALAGHSCDVAVIANTLCQDGQHRHGTSTSISRNYLQLSPRPTA